MRKYKVELRGYGGEMVLGSITEAQFKFWSQPDEVFEDLGFETFEPLTEYVMSREDWNEKIPEEGRIDADGWYYEPDDLYHHWGATYDGAIIDVYEILEDGTEKELYSGDFEDFSDEFDPVVKFNEFDLEKVSPPDADGNNYLYYAFNAEKGSFFEAEFEIEGELNLTKLMFECIGAPNDQDFLDFTDYDNIGLSISNEGGSTNGKGLDVEVWNGE